MCRWIAGCLTTLLLIGSLIVVTPMISASQSSDSPTPGSAGSLPGSSETIWFILGPEGQGNGDYFDVELDAGESTTLTAVIGNGSSIPVKALIYAADAFTDVNGGYALDPAGSEPTGTTTWLDFPPETRDFQAEEVIQREFTVSVPPDTPPGQYITGLAIETAESRPIAGNSPLRQSTRLVTAVFITVPGPVTPGFEVSDLSIEVDPFGMSLRGVITNTGNVRVRPEGSITLIDGQGRTVADIPIKMRSVYAYDATTFVVALPAPLAEGSYEATGSLVDADTGASASLEGVPVTAAPPAAPSPLSVSQVVLTPMPSADNVVFVQVTATISNTGGSVTGGELTLQVFRDGEQVDEHVLAASLTIANGETIVDQPYIPASGTWEAGAYTFQVTLSTTDPSSGAKSLVGTYPADQTIVVP